MPKCNSEDDEFARNEILLNELKTSTTVMNYDHQDATSE